MSDFIIPESCLSFSEKSLYLSEYVNNIINEMMKDIGINELKSFEENGDIIIYEEEVLDNLKDKFNNTLLDIKDAINRYWDNVYLSFNKSTEYRPISNNIINNLDNSKVYGKTHDFLGDSDIDFKSNSNKLIEQSFILFNKLNDINADDDELSSAKDELEKVLCGSIAKIEDTYTISDMKRLLKKKLTGDSIDATKEYISNNASKINNIVCKKIILKVINHLREEELSIIDNIIEEFNNNINDDFTGSIVHLSKIIIDIISIVHSCYAIECDVLLRKYNEYRNILVKVNSVEDKMVKESSDIDLRYYSIIEDI